MVRRQMPSTIAAEINPQMQTPMKRKSSPRTLLELALLNAEARRMTADELFEELRQRGVPPEITYRLRELWQQTKHIGGRVIAIGRIVCLKIARFLAEHPGLCVGAALGAALGVLAAQMPLIGHMLAPIVGAVAAIYGAAVGHGLDTGRTAEPTIILAWEAALVFFRFLVDLFRTICAGPDEGELILVPA